MKKLKGVNAVQTLSRLDRICPPFNKKTFILDFVNSYEDIQNAFALFYTTTFLSDSVTPSAISDPEDIDCVNGILLKTNIHDRIVMI